MIDNGHAAVQYVGAWTRQLHPIARISKGMMNHGRQTCNKNKGRDRPAEEVWVRLRWGTVACDQD